MKKHRLFILILLILIGFTSCVTTKTNEELTPLSLYSTRRFALENHVFFIGEGQSESMRQAELLSLTDLNNKVYRYLGLEVEPESYRELQNTGTIAAYGLKVQERSYMQEDGKYTFAIVASADRELLAKDRSSGMQKEEEIAKQAMDLVLQGDEFIKANRDLEGLDCYLQSMVLSYGLQYIDDEFSFASILEEVMHILEVLKIEVSNVDRANATCTVRITRHDTIIPSRVKNGTIKSTFMSEDSRGRTFEDSFMYTTNDKGVIKFEPRAYNISNSGTITLNFDFEDTVSEIEKLSLSTADLLRYAISTKAVSFDYNLEFPEKTVAVCIQSEDLNGLSSSETWMKDYIVNKYTQAGYDAFAFDYIEDENEQAIIERLKKNNVKADTLVIMSVGVNDVFTTRMDVCSVGVEGTVAVYDTKTGTIIFNSNMTYANGFGSTLEEAQDAAFENYILKMFELLKAYYV